MDRKDSVRMWTGFLWLWIGPSGGLLWTKQWTFVLHKRWEICRIAERLLAPQEGICSMELVISPIYILILFSHLRLQNGLSRRSFRTKIVYTRTSLVSLFRYAVLSIPLLVLFCGSNILSNKFLAKFTLSSKW
jgi:hypothetical protein